MLMNRQENILLFHGGGLGDLVLAADWIHSVRTAFPGALTLACLEPVAGIAELMPTPPDRVIPVRLNAYHHDSISPQLLAELGELTASLASPGVFVSGAYHPTWLTWFLASALRPGRSILHAPVEPPRGLLPCLLDEFELPAASFESASGEFAHETERYAALARMVDAEPLRAPAWTPPESGILGELGIEPFQYVACFPFGAVAEKCWPRERFREVLEAASAESGLPVVVLGSGAEREGLEELRGELPGARIFAGGPPDLRDLAALMAHCRAWIGNDTGPMHLAQAYRRPGVAIFGGGAGESYGPWADGASGVIHPLPCFGCLWDCTFGHGVCVESISSAAVLERLREALSGRVGPPAMTRLATVSEEPLRLIEHAHRRYQQASADRRVRFDLILELRREADQRLRTSARDVAGLEAILAEREGALLDKDAEIGRMREVAEERAAALMDRDNAVEEMRLVAEERGAALQAKDEMIEQMRQIAEERGAALQAMEAGMEEIRVAAEERQRVIIALDSDLRAALAVRPK